MKIKKKIGIIKSKLYAYHVYVAKHPLPFYLDRSWHLRTQLETEAMQDASQELLGDLDFESFRSVHCDAKHAIRKMMDIRIEEKDVAWGKEVIITFHANAYCRHMCRILAGTLVEVGQKKRNINSLI